MAVQDYKINYKSDFVLTINGDAGWAVPFCIKFWTGMPSQAYFVGFDGVKYVNCRVGDTPTQLLVMFDDHHLPIGPLRMQIAYHTTIEEFPGSVFDEVTNARDVIVTIDGTDYQVMLDFTGEDAPELEFNLPAYANEAERIQNELQRQQNEADRIAAELQREQATAAAVQGAENVNAQLNGTTLTVTNRQGVSTSVNTKGEQGEQGPVGPEGPQGETGISIVDFSPKSQTATTLIYTATFSDGHTQDVAIPKGPKGDTGATGPAGPQGPQGDTGVSITGLVKTGETETDTLYNVTFSDGTTQAVAIPKGEKGDQGEQGPQGPQGPMGDVAVITPEQQAAFTMYSEPGQNTDGPMTQKAVTDALVAGSISYDYSQSGLAAENVQGALDELYDDLYESTNIISENVFDIAAAAVATNNVTYVTPLKLEDGGRWTIAKKDTATNRVGHITIPVLVVGKTYKITFDYTSTLTVAASVQLCRYDSTSGSNVRVVTVSEHGHIAAGASGTYSFEFTYGATTTRYLGFIFKQPAVGQLIEIHNLTICETNSVKDAVQKLIDESLIQDSDADSDLDIVDPQNNVLARFYNGHIKTKNFDSSEWINLTSKFKDKKFAIVGDSISTYNGWLPSDKTGYSGSTYATYYPHTGGDVQSATQIWWYKLLVKLGITPLKWNNINVVSWSGSTVCGDSTSTTNAKPACSDKRITDIGLDGFTPDIIICFISCNDWGLDYALGTWQVSDAIPAEGNITQARAAYALMLHKIHTAYPKARVFCCNILDDIKRDRTAGWPSDNNNGVTTYQWNQNIKEIAEAFGCDIIDMHACGINYQNIASLVVDEGLHPNDEGHTMMAEKVFAELIAKY